MEGMGVVNIKDDKLQENLDRGDSISLLSTPQEVILRSYVVTPTKPIHSRLFVMVNNSMG